MPFWVKPLEMGMGCSLVWVAHAILGQTITIVYGLLMPFWVKPVQMDMGCSLVWVAHVFLVKSLQIGMGCSLVWVAHMILSQTSSNDHGLLFSMSCSYQNTLSCKDTVPTLIGKLLE